MHTVTPLSELLQFFLLMPRHHFFPCTRLANPLAYHAQLAQTYRVCIARSAIPSEASQRGFVYIGILRLIGRLIGSFFVGGRFPGGVPREAAR